MAEIKKVVIPVDFSSNTEKIVDYAMSVVDKLGAEGLFFHVVNDFEGWYGTMMVHPSFTTMTNDLEKKSKEQIATLVNDYKEKKFTVDGDVAVGDAAEEIMKYAKKQNADMIIIGTHGVKGLEKILMGSTAERVVKNAPCPVLIFNPFK